MRDFLRQRWIVLRNHAWKKGKCILPFRNFVSWYNKQEKKCYYCGVPEEKIRATYPYLKPNATTSLMINRRDPRGPYDKENIVLACIHCSTFKQKRVSEEEMLDIKKKFRQYNQY